jgi:hypothetical protein
MRMVTGLNLVTDISTKTAIGKQVREVNIGEEVIGRKRETFRPITETERMKEIETGIETGIREVNFMKI